jgi:hypothetical protein
VRLTPSGPQLLERQLLKIRRDRRVRVDDEAAVERHEYQDVGIWRCVSFEATRKASITKRALFATGALSGAVTIAFVTGGLGIVGAAVAAKIALGAGAGSGVAFGAGGALPSGDRVENYRKGKRLTEFESQEPLTDWLLEREVPLARPGPGAP